MVRRTLKVEQTEWRTTNTPAPLPFGVLLLLSLSYIYHTIIIYWRRQVSTIQPNDTRHQQSDQVLLVTQSTRPSSIRQP